MAPERSGSLAGFPVGLTLGGRPYGRLADSLNGFVHTEAELAGGAFVCGAGFSIADITTLVTVDFAKWIKLPIPESCVNLRRWHAEVSARPSAKA